MVGHLLRLKLALIRNGLRRSPKQLFGLGLGLCCALALAGPAAAGLVALRGADAGTAHSVVVLAGSGAVLGWAILPLVMSAGDLTLDPGRFATFAIPTPQLLAGLALGGLLGLPGIATTGVALASVATFSHSAAAAAAALLGAVVGLLSCVVLSKVVTSAAAGLAGTRRFKDFSALALLFPLVLTVPLVTAALNGAARAPELLPGLAQVLAWTPAGAAWSVGAEAAAGRFGTAALKLLIAGVFLGGLCWCWVFVLRRAAASPHTGRAARRRGGGPGLFALFPPTPAGAVAARCLSYWLRDPRYAGSLVVIALMPAVLFVQSSFTGSAAALLAVGPLAVFLLAWAISSDVSYDSTAFALHVASGVRGVEDRAGRAAACLVIAVPVVLIFGIGPFFLTSTWAALPGLLGLSIGILFSGIGLSSAVSARYLVMVPLPGESPFKKPPGNVAQTLAVQLAGMVLIPFLVAPSLGLVFAQVISGDVLFGWINLAVGPLLGLVVLLTGVRIGGAWLDARGPELLSGLAANS